MSSELQAEVQYNISAEFRENKQEGEKLPMVPVVSSHLFNDAKHLTIYMELVPN